MAIGNYLCLMQETLSIKIASADKERLRKIAASRGMSLSALLKLGVERVVSEAGPEMSPSCYDLSRKYFEEEGHLGESHLGDLSTNKAHLSDFGRNS